MLPGLDVVLGSLNAAGSLSCLESCKAAGCPISPECCRFPWPSLCLGSMTDYRPVQAPPSPSLGSVRHRAQPPNGDIPPHVLQGVHNSGREKFSLHFFHTSDLSIVPQRIPAPTMSPGSIVPSCQAVPSLFYIAKQMASCSEEKACSVFYWCTC
ncbi:transmembrane protein 178B [Platysternon megacephalum]|uniref:Transmembrane protein 178B n=1 Tax=Platysternon megacephalum TaxID=55544 RepID=A0A4D9E7Y1_9SAUR|nr:transmembrane protein 178B [Platysternon megacephalum]